MAGENVPFAALGLDDDLLAELERLGYEEPTPVQAAAIPLLLTGVDLLGRAATGTGKTAAFALPLLQRLRTEGGAGAGSGAPRALVLVPTRELAMQVSNAVHRYGRPAGTTVLPVYGGQPIGRQLDALRRGVDVVVATPGRAVDHLRRDSLDLSRLGTLVLDEADEMLDMGFAEDLDRIVSAVPDTAQRVLFSATIPERLGTLLDGLLRDPARVDLTRDDGPTDVPSRIRERAVLVGRRHKAAALGRLLDIEAPEAALVFCRTRHEVDDLAETLNGRGYRAEALHGGMGQEQRDRVMSRLRSGSADLLVATDVAARGLDVDTLTHVVNHDVPSAPETYVHRIGRVGRAGREGVAITLVAPRERRLLGNIERTTGRTLRLEPVPTVEDLRSSRLAQTVATLQEHLGADDLARYELVLEELAELDPHQVALAAVRMAHHRTLGEDDLEEIPSPEQPRGRARRPHGGAGGTAKVFVGLGRSAGLRPGDLVGAITGETRLHGSQIGAIRVGERHSTVEVPAGAVDEVLWSLRRTTLRGQRPRVRRDRGPRA